MKSVAGEGIRVVIPKDNQTVFTTRNDQRVFIQSFAEDERNKHYGKYNKNKGEFAEYLKSNLGSFFFENYTNLLNEVKDSALVFRYVYLCTFANYDNKLFNNHIPITKGHLPEILMLSKNSSVDIFNKLIRKKLIYQEENTGYLTINNTFFTRGQIDDNKLKKSVKMFDEGIRELYVKSNPREHKTIGLIISLLPYINFNWNIVCHNPIESDIDSIIPISIKELSNLFKIDTHDYKRFESKLVNIRVGGMPLISITTHADAQIIKINPSLYYKGNNLDNLKIVLSDFGYTNI